jgi:hypothetical protein
MKSSILKRSPKAEEGKLIMVHWNGRFGNRVFQLYVRKDVCRTTGGLELLYYQVNGKEPDYL